MFSRYGSTTWRKWFCQPNTHSFVTFASSYSPPISTHVSLPLFLPRCLSLFDDWGVSILWGLWAQRVCFCAYNPPLSGRQHIKATRGACRTLTQTTSLSPESAPSRTHCTGRTVDKHHTEWEETKKEGGREQCDAIPCYVKSRSDVLDQDIKVKQP